MKSMLLTLTALLLAGCGNKGTTPADTGSPNKAKSDVKEPDNTGINKRDADKATKTPIDQNENKRDIEITADIRKKIIAGDFSINGQNCKVITQDGRVTLRGPVKSAEEKSRIEEIAVGVAGAGKVDNQLEVSP